MVWRLCVCVGLLGVLAPGCSSAQSEASNRLRAGIIADAHAAEGQQYIAFGPLKDGQNMSVTTQMVNASSAVDIWGGSGIFVIHAGRKLYVKSIFLVDATIVCAHSPKTVCGRMASYIGIVNRSSSPEKTPFIEEAFPDLLEEARAARADSDLYGASLKAGIESLAGMITLHEMAHAALRHLEHSNVTQARQIQEEGEADGFAAYLAKLGDRTPAGAAIPFLFDTFQETFGGRVPVAHPPAICRVGLMTRSTMDWLQENKADALVPSDNRTRDRFAATMYREIDRRSALRELDSSWEAKCKPYMLSYALGFSKARVLITEKTRLDSTTPGQDSAPQTLNTRDNGSATSKSSGYSILNRLYATARQYASAFRRITCDERTHSEQNTVQGGFNLHPVHWKMDTVSEFRVIRDDQGVAGFKDSRVWRLQDGKPVPAGRSIVPPYLLNDAFGPASLSYLSPEHRECLRFAVHANRIDFATLPGRGGKGICVDIPPEAHGDIIYDPVTTTISHLERTVPLQSSLAGSFSPFASVDYQAVGFEGAIYMIPYKIAATKVQNGLQFSFEGTYTACRLFKADVVVRDMQGNVIRSRE